MLPPWVKSSPASFWISGVMKDSSNTLMMSRTFTRTEEIKWLKRRTDIWRESVNILFLLEECSSGSEFRSWPPPGTWSWRGPWRRTSCWCQAKLSSPTLTSLVNTCGRPSALPRRTSLTPPWRGWLSSLERRSSCRRVELFKRDKSLLCLTNNNIITASRLQTRFSGL